MDYATSLYINPSHRKGHILRIWAERRPIWEILLSRPLREVSVWQT